MADAPQEKKLPYARLVVIAFLLEWLGPAVIWIITRSISAIFFAGSITNAFLGFVFLLLCLPVGERMYQVQRANFAWLAWIADLVIRHCSFFLIGWPQSRRGWSLTLAAAAVCFFVTAVLSFFWALGDMKSADAITHWLGHWVDIIRGR